MSLKVHYLLTLSALFFLLTAWNKPQSVPVESWIEREYKLVKGKIDCISRYYNAKSGSDDLIKFN
jgi:hypothetical protein